MLARNFRIPMTLPGLAKRFSSQFWNDITKETMEQPLIEEVVYAERKNHPKFDIENMPHEDEYILDRSLLNAYAYRNINGWDEWCDEHRKLGKVLYYQKMTLEEMSPKDMKKTSRVFRQLKQTEYLNDDVLNKIVKEVCEVVKLKESKIEKLQPMIKALISSGHAFKSARTPFNPEANLVFLCGSQKSLDSVIGGKTPEDKQQKIVAINDIVKANGLNGLPVCRCVFTDMSWGDY